MTQHLFKLFLLSLLCTAWPGRVGAETLGLKLVETTVTEQPSASSHERRPAVKAWQKARRGLLHFFSRSKFGRLSDSRGKLIGGIVLMVVLIVIWSLIIAGFIALSMPMGAAGQPTTWKFPYGTLLVGLILPVFLIIGIVKKAKKLKQLRDAELPPEDRPRRPPSKKANQK